MFHFIVSALFPLVFAPQIEFAQAAPVLQRAKLGQIHFVATLASGKSEKLGGVGVWRSYDAQEICNQFAYAGANNWWTFQQDGPKLTVFDYEGEPIIGIRVVMDRLNPEDNKVDPNDQGVLPQVTVRWVPRVPPNLTRVELQPALRHGKPLARALSGAFVATVATVAAPELDFDTLPDVNKRPRVHYIRFHTRLASALDPEESYIGYVGINDMPLRFDPTARERQKGVLRSGYAFQAEVWFDVRAEPGNLRVALWDYRRREGDRVGAKNPVVGMMMESNGPVPALRWTFRPEVRKLLKKN